MIIAVTGYRHYTDETFIHTVMDDYRARLGGGREMHVRVGDAEGADKMVLEWCKSHGVSHREFKAMRFVSGALMPDEGPARNRRMLLGTGDWVAGLADLLIGFPRTRGMIRVPGSGTWGCMIEAASLRVRIEVPAYPVSRGRQA